MSKLPCITDDRLQAILFEQSPASISESVHLRTCAECNSHVESFRLLQSDLGQILNADSPSSFENAVRARSIERSLRPLIDSEERRNRLVTLWGALGAGLLLVALPAGDFAFQPLIETSNIWAQSQLGRIEQLCSMQWASLSQTAILMAVVALLILGSDLLSLRFKSRARA